MPNTRKLITAGLAAVTLAGALAASTESSAQGRYERRGHDRDGGAALAAGITGLALGAAIAGNGGHYYGGGYYAPRYAYAPRYYGGYYSRPYYAGGYARTCYYWRHDRWGRPYRVAGWC